MIHFYTHCLAANTIGVSTNSTVPECVAFFKKNVMHLKETENWTLIEKGTVAAFQDWVTIGLASDMNVNPAKNGAFCYTNTDTGESWVFVLCYGNWEYSITRNI